MKHPLQLTFPFLHVTGKANIDGTLAVLGDTTLAAVTVTGTLNAKGDIFNSTGDVTVGDNLGVTGNTHLVGTLQVDDTVTFAGLTLNIASSIFNSAGSITLNDAVNISGDLAIATTKFTVVASSGNTVIAGTLGVTGTSTLTAVICTTLSPSGDVAVATNKFTVAASTGNTLVAGTLTVTGDQTLTGRTAINGTLPSCRAERQAAQALGTSGVWFAIDLDTETWDTDGYFTASSKVMTIPSTALAGLYLICYSAQFDVNATGVRDVGVALNDSTDASAGLLDYRQNNAPAANTGNIGGSCLARLASGDTLTLKARQTSGGSLNVDNSSLGRSFGTSLEIVRLGG